MNALKIDTSCGYRPPMPQFARPGVGGLEALGRARKNVISTFERRAYFAPFFARKYLFRWTYFANSPQTIRHVLVTNANNYVKSRAMQRSLRPLMGNSILTSNGDEWQRQRKIANPLFTRDHLKAYGKIKTEEAAKLVDRWRAARAGEEVWIDKLMTDVTARIICRAMFSEELGERAHTVLKGSTMYQDALRQVDYAEMLGLPALFTLRPPRLIRRGVARVDRVTYDIIGERLKTLNDDRNDFISVLLNAGHEDAGQLGDLKDIRDQVSTMLLAGHETTANSLAWSLLCIAHDQGVAERLHDEAVSVLGSRKAAEYDDIRALKFTTAVIEEALRLYPGIPVLWRNSVDDDIVDGHQVRAGSNMIISPWLIHRHRLIWEKPNRFVPERFLEENKGPRAKFAYIPFGGGPRICIGATFAMNEAVILLATIMRYFRLTLREGHKVVPLARFSLRPEPGLPMSVRPW
ncbi:hypothetical protein MNBD_ALPHA09-2117 [hydrothermal vent metagenome]|uniref:Cytochrome P450 n=1 Tax=hydrothermal vent metagenome TaxID=652676 RepID=A0A3B0U1Z7_9ZZZZ